MMLVRGKSEYKYSQEDLDTISRCNMERCASFLARMIEKYGDEVLAEIEARDYRDTHREASPLVVAPGAVTVDTSDMDMEQSVAALMALAADAGIHR